MSLFDLGRIEITTGVQALVPPEAVETALRRHAAGDWGARSAMDQALNLRALRDGGFLLSDYTVADRRVLVQTAADRGRTRVLLPEEY